MNNNKQNAQPGPAAGQLPASPAPATESLCALCGYLLGNAQQYWLIHDEVAKWLLKRDAARAQQLAEGPAMLPSAVGDAAELLAVVAAAYRALPRQVREEPPF